MTARILQLLPSLTDINGDAQNALVLAQRLRWAGIDTEVKVFSAGDAVPDEAPAVVVLGSGVDSTLPRVREALEPLRATLEAWIDSGVPVVAVGTGMELLGRSIPLPGGALPGLGIVPGEATPLPARAASDLVVVTGTGRLTGYENHARGFVLASPAEPLGAVTAGTGNGEGAEGVRWKSVWGTHLHGPVLARNPAVADEVLAAAGFAAVAGGAAARVDELAQRVAARVEATRP